MNIRYGRGRRSSKLNQTHSHRCTGQFHIGVNVLVTGGTTLPGSRRLLTAAGTRARSLCYAAVRASPGCPGGLTSMPNSGRVARQ